MTFSSVGPGPAGPVVRLSLGGSSPLLSEVAICVFISGNSRLLS
jgi:hypothetical protein